MANPQDIIRKNTVVVDDGSGVILQPMTQEYSYVVTAKHVIQNDKDDASKGFKSVETINIFTINDTQLTAIELTQHPSLDLALIKIKYYHSDVQLFDNELYQNDRIELWGFPKYAIKHRNPSYSRSEWLECYQGGIVTVADKLIESSSDENLEVTGVVGFSGGGQWVIRHNKAFLCAIEYQVSKPDEYVNRINAVPVRYIQQLIGNENWQPVKPPYFANFEELEREVFQSLDFLNQDNKNKFRCTLAQSSVGKAKTNEFSPVLLLEKMNSFINSLNQEPSSLDNKCIWISVLEFLQVHELLSPQIKWNGEFIDYLSGQYKFLYLGSESWKQKLKSIVLFDCDNLKQDGILMLIQDQDNHNLPNEPDYLSKYLDPTNLLPSISNSITDENSIARIGSNQSKQLSIIHMKKLHQYPIDDLEPKLETLNRLQNSEEIKDLLVNYYGKYINIRER
jgi:hypothetical protein